MVRQVDSNLIQETNLSTLESQPLNDSSLDKKQTGITLSQLFNSDLTLSILNSKKASSVQSSNESMSLWTRICNWWYQTNDNSSASSVGSDKINVSDLSDIEPIDNIPNLEEPDQLSSDQIMARLHRKKVQEQDKITHDQLKEGVARMSDYSFEQIMFIILKGQIELEKETANATETTFSKYQQLQKLQENVLQEIKDVLAKDTKWAGYFKRGQQVTFALSLVAAVAALAFPLSWVATVAAPSASAGLAALTTGSKAYFDRRTSEDKAKHETFNHQDKYYTDRIENSRENLLAIADNDQLFKERLLQFSKRFAKMCKLVLSK